MTAPTLRSPQPTQQDGCTPFPSPPNFARLLFLPYPCIPPLYLHLPSPFLYPTTTILTFYSAPSFPVVTSTETTGLVENFQQNCPYLLTVSEPNPESSRSWGEGRGRDLGRFKGEGELGESGQQWYPTHHVDFVSLSQCMPGPRGFPLYSH